MDLREAIRDHCEGLTSFVAPVEAQNLAARIDDTEFAEWCVANKAVIIGRFMGDVLRSERAVNAHARKRTAFSDAVAEGDMSVFADTFVVSEDLTRKRFGDMVRADCLFVAAQYESTSNAALMEAAFHRAVAKKLTGGRTVSDVFDESTISQLRNRFPEAA